MNKALKQKWLRALRSGKYKQGHSALKDGKAFCCIGVLADVNGCTWKKGQPFSGGKLVGHVKEVGGAIQYGGTEYLRPRYVGISIAVQQKLAELNDSGKTFSEIAEHIEGRISAR